MMKKTIWMGIVALMACACGCDNAYEKMPEGTEPSTGGEVVPPPATNPAEEWAALADSCTNVLVTNFLDKTTGTFWSTPNDIERSTQYIYWQQAHALDVLLAAAGRSESRKETYLAYARK